MPCIVKTSPLIHTIFLTLCVCFTQFGWCLASPLTPIELSRHHPEQAIGQSLIYTLDSDHRLTLKDLNDSSLQWTRPDVDRMSFGITTETHWLKFEVLNDFDRDIHYLLEIANSRISAIEYFQISDHRIVHHIPLGMQTTISNRFKPHRHFVFPLDISKGETATLYLKITNDYPMKLPIYLRSVDEFHTADMHRILFQGFYFGCVVIMILYNLFIFFIVGDRSYLLYSTFVFSLAMLLGIDKGLAYQFLWPEAPRWDVLSYPFFVAIAAGMSVLFTQEFLRLKINAPRFHRFFNVLLVIWSLLAVGSLFLPTSIVIFLEVAVALPGGTALLLSGILMWKKRVPAAPYYTIAWAFIIQGATIYSLSIVGIFPDNLISEYAFQGTNIIEATLLSLGLAYRIKLLDRDKARAQASEKAKNEFLANMSHEIRTPMNGVLGMAQLMQETTLSQQQKSYISTILSSGNALLNILNDILDHSKIEAGKLEMENISFSFRRVMEEAASIFILKAANTHLNFYLWISPEVPNVIKGDPTRVRQIACNYLSNAFKFTTQGTVLLRCYLGEVNNVDSIIIEVQDSGIGIPQDKQGQLFNSFTQVSAATTRQYGGTGLGLSICKSLAELMGGTVGLRSEPNKGSCFWFSLPIHSSAPPPSAFKQQELKATTIKLFSEAQVVQDAFIEYQTNYGFQLQIEKQLPEGENNWESLLDSKVDKLILDLSQLEAATLQDTLRLLRKLNTSRPTIHIFIKPGLSEEHCRITNKSITLLEFPLAFTTYFNHLLKEELMADVDHIIDVEFNSFHGNILVVEDNAVNQKVIAGFLKKCQLQSNIVATGEEAIDEIQSGRIPDLILMDCNLPGIDGYETTREIRNILKDKQHPTIVALSAHAFEEHRNLCLSSGMNDHLSKPLIFSELQKLLAKYLLQQGSAENSNAIPTIISQSAGQ